MVMENRYWNKVKPVLDPSDDCSGRLHWIEPGDESGERLRTAQPSDLRAFAEDGLAKCDIDNTRIAALQR
jgi:hypothetical protein